jgi:hypothetical protein
MGTKGWHRSGLRREHAGLRRLSPMERASRALTRPVKMLRLAVSMALPWRRVPQIPEAPWTGGLELLS